MKYLYATDKNYYDIPYIIHCENINHENRTVKLREQTIKTLQENKKTRNKLGGENAHIQKCSNIPDTFNELVYQRECYQNFTYGLEFSPNEGKCRKNAYQNKPEYGHILRSARCCYFSKKIF